MSAKQPELSVLMTRHASAGWGARKEAQTNRRIPNLAEARELMIANRPELRIAEARAATGKTQLELARRNWIPDPAVTLQAQRYNDSRQAASELDAGVSFTLPWINPGKYSAAIHEARD